MQEHRLADLLDLTIVQRMADAHYQAAGMPMGIIDAVDGSILVGAGWQDICVKFHRVHPVSCQRCRESDNYIKSAWSRGVPVHTSARTVCGTSEYQSLLSDAHLATLFLGQFFYEGEIPDREFFIRLAHEFDFPLDDYLAALDRVPTFSREKVDTILEYDKALASFIADLATSATRKLEADAVVQAERRRWEEKIKGQAEFLQILMDAMPYPVFLQGSSGALPRLQSFLRTVHGITKVQIVGKTVYDLVPRDLAEVFHRADEVLFAHPGTQAYEESIESADQVRHDVNSTRPRSRAQLGT